jgi:hypothetical protein
MLRLMDVNERRAAGAARTFEEQREIGLAAKRERGELLTHTVSQPGGKITAATTDQEIGARAAQLAHVYGEAEGVIEHLLLLERRIAQLEAMLEVR